MKAKKVFETFTFVSHDDPPFSMEDLMYWKRRYEKEWNQDRIIKITDISKLNQVIRVIEQEFNDFEENTHPVSQSSIENAIILGTTLIDKFGFAARGSLEAYIAQNN